MPWTPVVLWSLAATQFFHATGHLPTFPSIQWAAAFVGFPSGHTGTILPASLVTLNTFSSHILFAGTHPFTVLYSKNSNVFRLIDIVVNVAIIVSLQTLFQSMRNTVPHFNTDNHLS